MLDRENLDDVIAEAIAVLLRGGIIAFPTETFYGLGVHFAMTGSLHRLYWLKMRPKEKAMPVIVGGLPGLGAVVSQEWLSSSTPAARALMNAFWPGPLTLLFPARAGLSEYITAETGKIAVRIPGESFALHLARKAGFPITATSANISGMPPAEDAESIKGYFGGSIDLFVDGGKTPGAVPSTIVDITESPPRIVREGVIRRDAIETVLLRL